MPLVLGLKLLLNQHARFHLRLQQNIYISLALFLSLSGCAGPQAISTFETLPAGKAAATSTRFEIIDDFNTGAQKNRFDAPWETHGSDGVEVKFRADRADGINHGGSVAIGIDASSAGAATLVSRLKGLDVSQAQALTFLVRADEINQFEGTVHVSLGDQHGVLAAVEVRGFLRPWNERWLQAVIPIGRFGAIDLNRLDTIQIVLNNPEPVRTRVTIDEIAFFGGEELVFRSARDNLAGFPKEVISRRRRERLLAVQDDRLLKEIARDSWRYFEDLIDRETGLVVDHARVGEHGGIGSYISPTNLALYWLANVAAYDLDLISERKARANIGKGLETLGSLKSWKSGLYYNYYHTHHLGVTRNYVSTVDNGWLAVSLAVIRQAFPDAFGAVAGELLDRMDFSELYDPVNGQLRIGYDGDTDKYAPYHYGLLATEARVASYAAIGKGDLDQSHWARIYRTLPAEWDWQQQTPEGTEAVLFGVEVFEGHYRYLDKRFIPSWGGSLFEFLAPVLVLDEQALAPEGLGKNNEVATDLHIDYALREKNYPVWGIAPCAIRSGRGWRYQEYGVPDLGAKGYRDRGVIAPYAGFLALLIRPEEAVRNIRELLARYADIYGEYGFYDSVNVTDGQVNYQYLALDQGMIFLALANFLKDGTIQKRFQSDPIGKAASGVVGNEKFSIN